MNDMDKAKEVREQRGAVYGDPSNMQKLVASHWTAILRSHWPDLEIPEIPPYLVGLMMACLKIHRIAAPFRKKDNDSYVDLHNYVNFSEENDPTIPE